MTYSENYRVKYHAKQLIGAVLLALSVATPAFADHDCARHGHDHWDSAKRTQMIEKFQARLHDQLKLTAAQEGNWKTFVEKTKPVEHDRKKEWSELEKLTTPERLDRLVAMHRERLDHMEARAKATKEFYASLTPEQQKTFDANSLPFKHDDQHEHHHE
jgi:protein CpxP